MTIKSTNKYSIITVCNYDTYADEGFKVDKQTDNQPTNNRQSTDNNIRNNRKNINNILLADESAKTNTEEDNIQELCMTYIVIYTLGNVGECWGMCMQLYIKKRPPMKKEDAMLLYARYYIISRLYRLYSHHERASNRRISARDIYILLLMLLELLDVPLSVFLMLHIESLIDVLVCSCCIRSWCWLIVSLCVFLMS